MRPNSLGAAGAVVRGIERVGHPVLGASKVSAVENLFGSEVSKNTLENSKSNASTHNILNVFSAQPPCTP